MAKLSQADLQGIADLTAKHIGLSIRPRIVITETQDKFALAYHEADYITIPRHAIESGQSIFIEYLVTHEICHFAPNCANHKKEFRAMEDKALQFWGIGIERKTIYPKRLWRI